MNKQVEKDRLWERAKGYEYVMCKRCQGSGNLSEGYTDHDGSGSFWVPGESCRCTFGQIKVKVSKEEQIKALKEIIKKLESKDD